MNTKKTILFVDDEPRVIDALRRMLFPYRNQWDMLFATSGHEALGLMDKQPVDIIVSDIRMPVMSGLELLQLVRERFPQTIRLVLSGQADRNEVATCVGPIHQYMSKPCDTAMLRATLCRLGEMEKVLSQPQLVRMVTQIESLPSHPSLFDELFQRLKSSDASIEDVGQIIARDMGMSAKVLQLVNSAFFGLTRHVSSPVEAAKLLGLDTLKALALSMQAFTRFGDAECPGFCQKIMLEEAAQVGARAKAIAQYLHADNQTADRALIAGLLHEVGLLVLVSQMSGSMRIVQAQTIDPQAQAIEVEAQIIGATHAQIGGYLLGLWGFASDIVDAVTYHHSPSASAMPNSPILIATHVASALSATRRPGGQTKLDSPWLQAQNLDGHLPVFTEICQSLTPGADRHAA